ncbi:Polyphosphate kinase [Streptomyces griseus]
MLELAEDPATPVLERANFLAIFASNLDEFFMVRVAGLKRRIATGVATRSASGLQPREVLDLIWTRSRELMARHAACFQQDIAPDLSDEGIQLIRWPDLTEKEQARLFTFFRQRVFPVLTPLAVDPAHPFPYISGLSLNLAVVVRNPVSGHRHFARVKVPPLLTRFLEASPQRYVPIEDVIAAHLEELFPGMEVLAHHMFRVTRNEDLEVEEDDAENLLQALEKELMRRRFGPPVRLEVEESIDPYVLDLLVRELKVSDAEVYPLPGPLDLTGLFAIASLDRPELKFPKFIAGTHRDLAEVESASAPDIFAALRERDVLLHHPYDSFSTSVQAFLEQAAGDPDVLAIKQTLYRTSGDSPIVDALIDAAESGKQVLVLVEIKARFDEQANIKWARKLEEAGCHVVYGLVGLKTHCKLSLVVRQEGDTLRRYSHVGTGNYHPKTARLYEDLGLLTADPQVGADLSDLFNRLSGYSRRETYRRLLVAPKSLRDGLIARINKEIAHHRAGRPAYVRFKVNSMVDEAIIDACYRAAQAGVPVDIWVRGICAIRPGVAGLSENIRVRSILGRFLEHSRVFSFGNGGEPEVWFGSADMMHRNLDRRIEALVRVTDPAHRAALSRLLETGMADTTSSWHLGPDGNWTRHATDADGQPLRHVQEMLIDARRRRRATPTSRRRPGRPRAETAPPRTRPRGTGAKPSAAPYLRGPGRRSSGPPRACGARTGEARLRSLRHGQRPEAARRRGRHPRPAPRGPPDQRHPAHLPAALDPPGPTSSAPSWPGSPATLAREHAYANRLTRLVEALPACSAGRGPSRRPRRRGDQGRRQEPGAPSRRPGPRRPHGGRRPGRRPPRTPAHPRPDPRPLRGPPGPRLLPLPRGRRRRRPPRLRRPARPGRARPTARRSSAARRTTPSNASSTAVAALPLTRAAHPYNADGPLQRRRRTRPGTRPGTCCACTGTPTRSSSAREPDPRPAEPRATPSTCTATPPRPPAAAAAAARTPRIAPATAYALGVLHADQRHEVEAARAAFRQPGSTGAGAP